MRRLLAILLLVPLLALAQALPKGHPPVIKKEAKPAEATWVKFKDLGPAVLFFDLASMHGEPTTTGVAAMTIRLQGKSPTTTQFASAPVKTFINTLFIECEQDQLTVLVSQMYDKDGDLVGTARFYIPLPNPHQENQSITEVLDFACSQNPKYPNKRNMPSLVTPDDEDGV